MRFLSFTFKKLGRFTEQTLDVSSGHYGLHLVVGANEAGKTTSLRGLGYFLFGFPHRKCDDFRHPAAEQRIIARIRGRNGEELEALRRRGASNTLRAPNDKTAISEQSLARMMGHITEDQYGMLFGLTHDQLVEGGQLLAQGESSLGKALFAARAGLAGLRGLERTLQTRQDELYKVSGKSQLIPLALQKRKAAQDVFRDKVLQIESWSRELDTSEIALAKQKELEERRRREHHEADRLKAFRSALPSIDTLKRLERRLAELADVRSVDPESESNHRRLITSLQIGEHRLADLATKLAADRESVRQKCPEPEILGHSGEIGRLSAAHAQCQKAKIDAVGLYRSKHEQQGRAKQILQDFFGRKTIDEAEELRLTQAAITRIRELAQERQGLTQAIDGATGRLGDLDSQIARKENELAPLAPVMCAPELASIVSAVLQEGPLEQDRCDLVQQMADLRGAIESAASHLVPSLTVGIGDLDRLALPSTESIERYEKLFNDFDSAHERLADRLERLSRERREITAQLAILRGQCDVCSEDELAASRLARDSGIRLLRPYEIGTEPDTAAIAAFVNRHAPGGGLVDGVSESVGSCDKQVDLLRKEAERAAQIKVQLAEADRLDGELAEGSDGMQIVVADREAADREWNLLWSHTQVSPRTPREMLSWSRDVRELLQKIGEIAHLDRRFATLSAIIGRWQVRLQTVLAMPADDQDRSLAELLAIAQDRLSDVEERLRIRESLVASLGELRTLRQNESGAHDRAQHNFREWRERWAAAIMPLGLAPHTEPGTAHTYLSERDRLFEEFRNVETTSRRLANIEKDLVRFLSVLTELRRRIDGPNTPESTADSMSREVEELERRLKVSEKAATEQNQLAERIRETESVRSELEVEVAGLRARVCRDYEQMGVVDEGEFCLSCQKSVEKRELLSKIEEQRSTLCGQAGTQALGDFCTEAEGARSRLEARLAELEDNLEPLNVQISEQVVLAGAAGERLRAWRQASADAADAKQEIESCASQVNYLVEEFATVHVTRRLLSTAIDHYRIKHQGSTLRKAEHYFRMLTDGAFASLEVDDADGKPLFWAVRASPSERVPVEGLSDGTRDQLFLALRLAGIDEHLDQQEREPMPLLLDDPLINFDDARTRSALRCLGELSRKTQIIMFSHHPFLKELASECLSSDVLCCHSLS